MSMFGGQRTHIITDKDPEAIMYQLGARGIYSGHFTNGTFTLPLEKFAPTFLAAFKRVSDIHDDVTTPLIVAINSDVSMKNSYARLNEDDRIMAHIMHTNEETRAYDVVTLLSYLYPRRSVAAIFYDEDTPYELYSEMKQGGFGMKSLHKVGYGTSPDDKPIIGAKFFDWVYACPLPFDAKPVMHTETRNVNATDRAPDLVEKLTDVMGPHGRAYMTTQGKVLFPVSGNLSEFADPLAHKPAPNPSQP
jgi:hypothetical protein